MGKRIVIKVVSHPPETPCEIYAADDYRVILRDLSRYPEGYVEIERESKDALGNPRWIESDSISLDYAKQTGHVAVRLFILLMRQRCAALGLVLKETT